MLNNLNNTLIDCIYKCAPSSPFDFKLMVLSGYDFNKKNWACIYFYSIYLIIKF